MKDKRNVIDLLKAAGYIQDRKLTKEESHNITIKAMTFYPKKEDVYKRVQYAIIESIKTLKK
jgi:ribosomal protein S8